MGAAWGDGFHVKFWALPGKYDLTITLWDDENAVEPLDWANYKRAARVDYDDDSDSDFASDLSFDQDEFNSWLKEID